MEIVFLLIVIGISLLCLGIAAARVIAAVHRPGKHIDKTVTDPILLDG